MTIAKLLTIGIDATNLRGGGGVTHLVELLRALQPSELGIERIVVWGGTPTLHALDNRTWLDKRTPPALDQGLLQRTLWQRCVLSRAARAVGCDLLFVPGGSYAGNFHPAVTMSQNLLPFEMRELRRYGWTILSLKLLLLRFMQSRSFRNTDGVIFLTNYARKVVLGVTGPLPGQTSIVPHGIHPRFQQAPKPQRAIADYDDAHPFRLLYVSIIDHYKHQWQLVEAVANLREQTRWPLALDLVGPANPSALERLQASLRRFDPEGSWVNYHGTVPYADLHRLYGQADLGIFASSCENMPNILLETMASGLPVACSYRGPMPEVLQDTGVYFDPENPGQISTALNLLIESQALRAEKAQKSHEAAKSYSWERCAAETFAFLTECAQRHQRKGKNAST